MDYWLSKNTLKIEQGSSARKPRHEQVLFEYERLTLSNRDRDLFLSALDNPPKLKGKLKTAIANYRDKYGE